MTPEQQAAVREAVEEAVHAAICDDDGPASIADAAIAAHMKALEAAGYTTVPVDPTTTMRRAGASALLPRSIDLADECWRVMISARPR